MSFSNDPNQAGYPSGPAWQGQPNVGQGQPNPAWQGQPAPAGTPPQPPTWLAQNAQLPPNMQPTPLKPGSNWPALRLIALCLKVIAWIELVLGIILSLTAGNTLGALGAAAGGGFITIIFLLIIAVTSFMFTYASSEGILVFLAIEKNTRKN